MKSSLSLKILLVVSLVVCFCLLLLGLVEVYLSGMRIESRLNDTLNQVTARLAHSLAMPMWNIDREMVAGIVATEMQDRNVYAVTVRDDLQDSFVVALSRDREWHIVSAPEPETLRAHLSAEARIAFAGNTLGNVSVYVTDAFTGPLLMQSMSYLGLRLAILLLLVTAVLICAINILITRPIFRLSRSCGKIEQGDFDVTLDTGRRDEIGGLARSFAHMRDAIQEKIAILNEEIEERRRSEEELRRLREYLDNVVDSMPSILLSVDPRFRVTQWNSEAEKIIGITREEALRRPLPSLMPGLDNILEEIWETVGAQKRFFRQRMKLASGGLEGLFDIAAYPMLANGSDGAVIRIDDVTERAHLEAVMVQTEKMMSVGGLAAGMAHEINNPLAGIMQSVQVIANRLSPALRKNSEAAAHCGLSLESLSCYVQKRQIDDMLGSIMASGERASRIINNMLSFSRKSVSRYTPCDVSELLDKTVELAANDYDLKKRFDFKDIEIVRVYGRSLPEVRCDSTTLQQVFFNLLKNSAQAMKSTEDGWVAGGESGRPRIILRTYVSDGWFKIEVEDNGIGMDEKTQKRIFEPFFTTKEVDIGTGLGLSVSFFIIKENHNGTIEVDSRPGKGTVFTLGLPL